LDRPAPSRLPQAAPDDSPHHFFDYRLRFPVTNLIRGIRFEVGGRRRKQTLQPYPARIDAPSVSCHATNTSRSNHFTPIPRGRPRLGGFFSCRCRISSDFLMNTETSQQPLRSIEIYDTTLRDGTQGEGVSFSLQDKLNIAQRLAEIGIDY